MFHTILTDSSLMGAVAAAAFILGLVFSHPLRLLLGAIAGDARRDLDRAVAALDSRLSALEGKRSK